MGGEERALRLAGPAADIDDMLGGTHSYEPRSSAFARTCAILSAPNEAARPVRASSS